MERTLKILPYHPPYEWTVESGSRSNIIHICKLADNQLNGSCSCEFFQFTLQPLIDSYGSKFVPDDQFRCKHLKQLREIILNTLLANETGPEKFSINPRVLKQ